MSFCYICFEGIGCHLPDCPGNPDCNGHGDCPIPPDGEDPKCTNCDDTYMGDGCELRCISGMPQQINGTWECICEPCYAGLACEKYCNDKSTFCLNGVCDCGFDGWRGDTCTLPGCPGFGEDCTGHGECNRASGRCYCTSGWQGVGCHEPDCPGTPDCFGKGDCVPEEPVPVCRHCDNKWIGEDCNFFCDNGREVITHTLRLICYFFKMFSSFLCLKEHYRIGFANKTVAGSVSTL